MTARIAYLVLLLISLNDNLHADTMTIALPSVKNPKHLSLGADYGCLIDDEGVKCWGTDRYGEAFLIPKTKNPREVAASWFRTYVIDDEGVKCWGSDCDEMTFLSSSFVRPTSLTAGERHACVIDEANVHCWTSSGFQKDLPKFKNPKSVSAGRYHTCVIDEGDIKCWGSDSDGQVSKKPILRNPIAVSAGSFHTCALDADGIKCWGKDFNGQISKMPLMNKVKLVVASFSNSCAIDLKGVRCWGYDHDGLVSKTPPMLHPISVDTSHDMACAINKSELKCWGKVPDKTETLLDSNSSSELKPSPATNTSTCFTTKSSTCHEYIINEGNKACRSGLPKDCYNFALGATVQGLGNYRSDFLKQSCKLSILEACLLLIKDLSESKISEDHETYLTYKKACSLGHVDSCPRVIDRNIKNCSENELDACYQIVKLNPRLDSIKRNEFLWKACNGGHKNACDLLPQKEVIFAAKLKSEKFAKLRSQQLNFQIPNSIAQRISSEIPNSDLRLEVVNYVRAVEGAYTSLKEDQLWVTNKRELMASSKCIAFLTTGDGNDLKKVDKLINDYKKLRSFDLLENEDFKKTMNRKLRNQINAGFEDVEKRTYHSFCKKKLDPKIISSKVSIIESENQISISEPFSKLKAHPFFKVYLQALEKQAAGAKLSQDLTFRFVSSNYLKDLMMMQLIALLDMKRLEKTCPGVINKAWEKCKTSEEYKSESDLLKLLCVRDPISSVDGKCFDGLSFVPDKIIERAKSIQVTPEEAKALAGKTVTKKCDVIPEFKEGILEFKEDILVAYDFSPSYSDFPNRKEIQTIRFHDSMRQIKGRHRSTEQDYQFYEVLVPTKYKVIGCTDSLVHKSGSRDLLLQNVKTGENFSVDSSNLLEGRQYHIDFDNVYFRFFKSLESGDEELVKSLLPKLLNKDFSEYSYKQIDLNLTTSTLALLLKELPQLDPERIYHHLTYSSGNDASKEDLKFLAFQKMNSKAKVKAFNDFFTSMSLDKIKIALLSLPPYEFSPEDKAYLSLRACMNKKDKFEKIKLIEENGLFSLAPVIEENSVKYSFLQYLVSRSLTSRDVLLECAKFLVGRGQNIHEVDSNGNNLLHLAAIKGEKILIEYFVKLGVSKIQKNKDGKIPFDLVSRNMRYGDQPYVLKWLEVK